jgi:hypothetical protein
MDTKRGDSYVAAMIARAISKSPRAAQKKPRRRRPRPVVLCILDGWGSRPDAEDNAITRSEPENIDILRRCWSGPLDPAIPKDRKGFNSRAIIDATRPYEWKDQFPPVNAVSDRLKAELDTKYAALLKDILRGSQ